MKKVITYFLIFLLSVSLTGCHKKQKMNESSDLTEETVSETESETEEETSTEAESEDTEEAESTKEKKTSKAETKKSTEKTTKSEDESEEESASEDTEETEKAKDPSKDTKSGSNSGTGQGTTAAANTTAAPQPTTPPTTKAACDHTPGDWVYKDGFRRKYCSKCGALCAFELVTPENCPGHEWVLDTEEIYQVEQVMSHGWRKYHCKNCSALNTEYYHVPADYASWRQCAAEVVAMVNAERQSLGLNTLVTYPEWDEYAQLRAQEASVVYGHNRPDGSSWQTLINGRVNLAENLGGCNNSQNAFDAFYNSPPHHASYLIEDVDGIAVGIYADSTGRGICIMEMIHTN